MFISDAEYELIILLPFALKIQHIIFTSLSALITPQVGSWLRPLSSIDWRRDKLIFFRPRWRTPSKSESASFFSWWRLSSGFQSWHGSPLRQRTAPYWRRRCLLIMNATMCTRLWTISRIHVPGCCLSFYEYFTVEFAVGSVVIR